VYRPFQCSTKHLVTAMLHDACNGLHAYKEGFHILRSWPHQHMFLPSDSAKVICVQAACAAMPANQPAVSAAVPE
jgi:hypothetical protein